MQGYDVAMLLMLAVSTTFECDNPIVEEDADMQTELS